MRRRAKRDLLVMGGIALLLCGIAAANYAVFGRKDYNEYWQKRLDAEAKIERQGLELLDWTEIQKTTGTLSKGGEFSEYLQQWDGLYVDIMGFTTPLNEFRNVREFILLPVPIECYFCRIPPAHDVIVVQMAEDELLESMYEDPVLLHGKLTLNKGPKSDYFYTITEAKLGPGDYTKKRYNEEHMTVHEPSQETLVAPMDVPKVDGVN